MFNPFKKSSAERNTSFEELKERIIKLEGKVENNYFSDDSKVMFKMTKYIILGILLFSTLITSSCLYSTTDSNKALIQSAKFQAEGRCSEIHKTTEVK